MEPCCIGCGRPGLFPHGKGGRRFRCEENREACPVNIERNKAVRARAAAKFYGKVDAAKGEPQPCACGAPGRFYSVYYRTWRCEEVAGACPANQAKVGETLSAKHGTTKIAHIAGVQAKRSATLRQSHAARGEEGRKAIAAKRIATIRERFGVENPSQRPEHWEGIKERMRELHGVEHWLQTPEGLAKQRETVRERYGVDHVLQNPDVFRLHQRNFVCPRIYRFPSGREVKVRGHEGFGLDHLLSLGFAESDLTVATVRPTRIFYTAPDGVQRAYYPDIRIESLQHLIEVKSPYTLYAERFYAVNVAKWQATVAAGWPYTILVFDRRGTLVELVGDSLD